MQMHKKNECRPIKIMYFQDHVINNNVIERSSNNGCKIWMHKYIKYVGNIIKCTF